MVHWSAILAITLYISFGVVLALVFDDVKPSNGEGTNTALAIVLVSTLSASMFLFGYYWNTW